MEQKPLPIGIENFEEMIQGGYYYVDKTGLLKDLIDHRAKVNLFTRPRRFGKTLNISMLRYFFDKNESSKSNIFKGLQIMDMGKKYIDEMNKYPIISITLKDVGGATFKSSFYHLKMLIHREFIRHRYLLESDKLIQILKDKYNDILAEKASDEQYEDALKFLSECLEFHYNEKVLILIDEYDVPLETAYFNGYYHEMIHFIRSLFGSALKTNDSLAFAVMTGCLRVSRESIFTGLNNLNIESILSDNYVDYFGFTEPEIENALAYYQAAEKHKEMKAWYNGYLFGAVIVYNPWSVIKYLDAIRININRFPDPHWSNTSSNHIIHELIEIADNETKDEIELLIRGGSIQKPVFEDIVYDEIKADPNNLWNFLFFTGYLKKVAERFENRKRILTLAIPNEEILSVYERKINEWFNEKIKIKDTTLLLRAILEKDIEQITDILNTYLMNMISFHDSAENFYHGFLIGILANIRGYQIKSNRESGLGRSDIYMKSTGIRKRAVVFECKTLKENEDPEEKGIAALLQIEQKKYAYELQADGYQDVLKYAVVFRGKECLVMA
jgi:hypothetical protein